MVGLARVPFLAVCLLAVFCAGCLSDPPSDVAPDDPGAETVAADRPAPQEPGREDDVAEVAVAHERPMSLWTKVVAGGAGVVVGGSIDLQAPPEEVGRYGPADIALPEGTAWAVVDVEWGRDRYAYAPREEFGFTVCLAGAKAETMNGAWDDPERGACYDTDHVPARFVVHAPGPGATVVARPAIWAPSGGDPVVMPDYRWRVTVLHWAPPADESVWVRHPEVRRPTAAETSAGWLESFQGSSAFMESRYDPGGNSTASSLFVENPGGVAADDDTMWILVHLEWTADLDGPALACLVRADPLNPEEVLAHQLGACVETTADEATILAQLEPESLARGGQLLAPNVWPVSEAEATKRTIDFRWQAHVGRG